MSTILKLDFNFTTKTLVCKGVFSTFLLVAAWGCTPTVADHKGPGSVADLRPDAPDLGGNNGADVVDLPPPDITIATWNVERYFDTRCDTGQCSRGDYEALPSPEAFAERGEAIADAIRELDADVVLLQEVESQASLDEIAQHLEDIYPVAELGEIGFAASVDVAVLARGERRAVRRHRHNPIERPDGSATSFARELLEVEVEIDGRDVIVLCAHFKSKSGDDAGRREGEAVAARTIALETAAAHPDALVVLGGDLNDTPGSPPMDALLDAGDLLRVASDLGDDDWTYLWNDEGDAIDHLLLVVGSGEYIPGTAEVLRDGRGWRDSDHASLRAEFR